MKTPLVVLIAIMVCIIGFLVVYSQQREVSTVQAAQGHGGAAGGYGSAAAPASGGYGSGAAPASGGYGSAAAPAAGGYGAAPAAAGGYGAPAPKSGGYGAPAAGGYGK